MLKLAIRYILTGVFIYFIYRETGIVTAAAFLLMAVKDELMAKWMRIVNECLGLLGGKRL